jgi:hypothetical protein
MPRYRMQDGTVVDTDLAKQYWQEATDHDGRNPIGRSSQSQWHDQTLYQSRKGRYYIEYESRVEGQRSHVEWVSPEEAARWLILNEKELPEDLKPLEAEVVE